MAMIGGLPPPRPDQRYNPPASPGPVGAAAGIFRGRLVIIRGGPPPASGFFLYDLAGNLIGSFSLAGPAPAGGTAKLGLTSYNPPDGRFTELDGGTLFLGSSSPSSRATTSGSVSMADAVTDAEAPGVLIVSPETASADLLLVSMQGKSKDGTQPTQLLVGKNSIGSVTDSLMELQGAAAAPSLDVAPAATAPPARPAGTEPWNYVGAAGQPAFGAGWSNFGGGFAHLAFRFVAAPSRCVQVKGEVTHTAAASQTIFTLPAAYVPASSQQFTCMTSASGVVGVEVSAAGAVELLVAPAAIVTHNVDLMVSLDI